ncbi:MAG TPA: hypothetical protein V6D03_02735 [Candidatus Caenarcaniphilales bacterium]
MKTKVAFWLIPSEGDRVLFQAVINTLSQRYDAPTFTPHVTIYLGDYAPDEFPAEVIAKAIQGVSSFSLKVAQLLYTEAYTKTLFIQFHPSAMLSNLSNALARSSSKPSNFVLNPHMSLIYQHLDQEIKHSLMTSLTLPKTEVFFNEVRAILTPEEVQRREEVERWHVIWMQKLHDKVTPKA